MPGRNARKIPFRGDSSILTTRMTSYILDKKSSQEKIPSKKGIMSPPQGWFRMIHFFLEHFSIIASCFFFVGYIYIYPYKDVSVPAVSRPGLCICCIKLYKIAWWNYQPDSSTDQATNSSRSLEQNALSLMRKVMAAWWQDETCLGFGGKGRLYTTKQIYVSFYMYVLECIHIMLQWRISVYYFYSYFTEWQGYVCRQHCCQISQSFQQEERVWHLPFPLSNMNFATAAFAQHINIVSMHHIW